MTFYDLGHQSDSMGSRVGFLVFPITFVYVFYTNLERQSIEFDMVFIDRIACRPFHKICTLGIIFGRLWASILEALGIILTPLGDHGVTFIGFRGSRNRLEF